MLEGNDCERRSIGPAVSGDRGLGAHEVPGGQQHPSHAALREGAAAGRWGGLLGSARPLLRPSRRHLQGGGAGGGLDIALSRGPLLRPTRHFVGPLKDFQAPPCGRPGRSRSVVGSMFGFSPLGLPLCAVSVVRRCHAHSRQLSSAGVAEWRCVPVIHCRDAWGLVLRLASGFKLVVSGDTRPCRRLAQAGRAATLLIHEATFDDALLSQATEKRHSTMGEAHRAAREMGAYRTVLTHFSQRYGKWLPQVQEEDAFVKERCATAFDGMHVPLILIPWLPSLMPAVVTALSEGGDGEANEAEMAGASG
eukprot:jgi/Botrbrau1/3929/Bobra.0365s0005.1